MRTIDQTRASLRGARIFPSVAMAWCALVFWLCGQTAMSCMSWLCLVSALVTARHVFVEAKLPGMLTWFAVSYIGLFLVYPYVAPLLDIEIPTSNDLYMDYCFLAVVGLHLFIIGYELAAPLPARRRWVNFQATTSNRLSRLLIGLLILNIFAAIVTVADAGKSSAFLSVTRNELMSRAGVLTLAGVYLLGFGSVLYPLAAVQVYHRRLRATFWLPTLICLEVVLFLTFRVRTFAVMHAIGLLVGWFVIAPRIVIVDGSPWERRKATRLTSVQKSAILAFVLTLTMSMFVLRIFRGQMESAHSLAEIDINLTESTRFALEEGGELGYSRFVFRILEVVPAEHDYLYGQSYYRLLFTPIPRSVWPNKPLDSQRITAHWIDPNASVHQTTPVGIIGDLYANFGKWGIVGMLVFGYAFGVLDRGVHLRHALFVAVSFPMIFHMARGSFTNTVVELLVYYIIARVVANHVCQVTKQRSLGLRISSHALT